MKLLIKILIGLVITAQLAFAQENKKDSTAFNPNMLSPFQLNLHEDDLYRLEVFGLYLSLHSNNNLPINKDPNTKWLWTKAILSNFNQSSDQQTANLNNMLSLQYGQFINDSKFNPFRYALGMAQLGAVGYLAYKHIKKYGFR
jgi:hypothetical protein